MLDAEAEAAEAEVDGVAQKPGPKKITLKDFFMLANKGKKLKKPFDIFHNAYDMENYGPDAI